MAIKIVVSTSFLLMTAERFDKSRLHCGEVIGCYQLATLIIFLIYHVYHVYQYVFF